MSRIDCTSRSAEEPGAVRIGEALAKSAGCEVEVYRRPADLGSLLADLVSEEENVTEPERLSV